MQQLRWLLRLFEQVPQRRRRGATRATQKVVFQLRIYR